MFVRSYIVRVGEMSSSTSWRTSCGQSSASRCATRRRDRAPQTQKRVETERVHQVRHVGSHCALAVRRMIRAAFRSGRVAKPRRSGITSVTAAPAVAQHGARSRAPAEPMQYSNGALARRCKS